MVIRLASELLELVRKRKQGKRNHHSETTQNASCTTQHQVDTGCNHEKNPYRLHIRMHIIGSKFRSCCALHFNNLKRFLAFHSLSRDCHSDSNGYVWDYLSHKRPGAILQYECSAMHGHSRLRE